MPGVTKSTLRRVGEPHDRHGREEDEQPDRDPDGEEERLAATQRHAHLGARLGQERAHRRRRRSAPTGASSSLGGRVAHDRDVAVLEGRAVPQGVERRAERCRGARRAPTVAVASRTRSTR